jgi:hypothetical protein
MKTVQAYGGKMMFWQDHGGGWSWCARRPYRSHKPRPTTLTNNDGEQLYIFGSGSYGEGHSHSLRDARRAALTVLR